MRTYLISRPIASMDEHLSLSLCDPSSTSLDVGCRRHSFIFEAVCEVELFLTTNRPGIMMHGALLHAKVSS